MVDREERRWRRIAGDRFRMTEVERVVAAAAAEGGDERERLPSSPGAADALLIVEALRRHVGLIDGLQGADVDADLHGGGHRQHVDLLRVLADHVVLADEDVLEPPSGGPEKSSVWPLSSSHFSLEARNVLVVPADDPASQEVRIPQILDWPVLGVSGAARSSGCIGTPRCMWTRSHASAAPIRIVRPRDLEIELADLDGAAKLMLGGQPPQHVVETNLPLRAEDVVGEATALY